MVIVDGLRIVKFRGKDKTRGSWRDVSGVQTGRN
jgi:hypothetical protein